MKYTSLHPDEIRQKVYEEAKKQFLEKGIANTEMKQIAQTVGIGRTTLYRYYPSIHRLAFMAATQIWDDLYMGIVEKGIEEWKTGYEILCAFYEELVEKIAVRPRELLFFSQFDAIFQPPSFPDFPEAEEYKEHLIRVLEFMEKLVQKGQADGSLRKDVDVIERLNGISHALMGYEQRTALYPAEWRLPGKDTMHWMARCMLRDLKGQEG